MAKRRQPERVITAQIVRLLEGPLVGGKVYKSSTARRRGDYQGTMQTPGIPDLEAFLPPPIVGGNTRLLKIEVKAPKGRMSPAQKEYRQFCLLSHTHHIVGGLDEVYEWLHGYGYFDLGQIRMKGGTRVE